MNPHSIISFVFSLEDLIKNSAVSLKSWRVRLGSKATASLKHCLSHWPRVRAYSKSRGNAPVMVAYSSKSFVQS